MGWTVNLRSLDNQTITLNSSEPGVHQIALKPGDILRGDLIEKSDDGNIINYHIRLIEGAHKGKTCNVTNYNFRLQN